MRAKLLYFSFFILGGCSTSSQTNATVSLPLCPISFGDAGWEQVNGLNARALLQQGGSQRLTFVFEDLGYNLEDDLLRASVGGKGAYMDAHGKMVIPPTGLLPDRIQSTEAFAEGKALARDERGFGFIDRTGSWVIPPQFADAQGFSGGLAAVVVPAAPKTGYYRDQKWGYIDGAGNWVIQPGFRNASPFADGIALVGLPDETRLYIDRTGKTALTLPPKYGGDTFQNGHAVWMPLGQQGTSMSVLVDRSGQELARYAYIGHESDGMRLVRNARDEVGYIDGTGRLVIPIQFARGALFREGLAGVQLSTTEWGFIDKNGKAVITGLAMPEGHTLNPSLFFSGGMAVVRVNGRSGAVDRTGALAVPPQFDEIWSFEHGFAPAKQGGKYGIIDTKGRWVLSPQFDFARSIGGTRLLALRLDWKYAIATLPECR